MLSRTLPLLCPALALCLLPSSAPAGEPLDVLDTAQGAIPIDGNPPTSPAGLTATQRPAYLGDKILFLNFEGGDMNFCGNNNPVNNCSTIYGGNVLPYTGDLAQRASIVQIIRKRVQDVGITVTDQRPDSGDYDMEMVGNWQGQDPPFAGVAPNIDCFDATGGETSFTLEASSSADGIAEIVLQEVAHTWGLEHVDEQQDLLFPTTQGSNKTFRDECLKIVSDTELTQSNGQCNSVHTNFCDFGWQNSYQELLFLFGPSLPDTIAPAVSILSPENGATIDGGDLDLLVELRDDQSPAVISMDIILESDALPEPVESGGAFAAPSELPFPIMGLPDGEYTVRVDILDESDNPATDEVSFTVIGNPPEGGDDSAVDESGGGEGSGGAGTGGDGSGDGSGGADGTSSAGVVDPPGSSADGCDCRTGRPTPGPGLGLGLLALLGLVRRRRT